MKETLARSLRRRRRELGFSQKEVARLFRVQDRQYISALERETRLLPKEWLPQLARFLNCPLSELVERYGEERKQRILKSWKGL